jgi:hypothetical protein
MGANYCTIFVILGLIYGIPWSLHSYVYIKLPLPGGLTSSRWTYAPLHTVRIAVRVVAAGQLLSLTSSLTASLTHSLTHHYLLNNTQ